MDGMSSINSTKRTRENSATTKNQNIENTKSARGPIEVGKSGKTDTTGKGTNVASGQFSAETKELVDQFYNAVYGVGTDDKAMTDALSKINKDNIMDVMRCWNKYHSNESGESFMEAFLWDAGHSDKKKYGKQIENLLRDKADELGIYDQCKNEFSKIDKEMRAVFYVSNDVSIDYDSVINKIALKEGLDYGQPHKKD